MTKFVVNFRNQEGRHVSSREIAEWQQWFKKLGPAIADMGSLIGRSTRIGPDGIPGGYMVLSADTFDAAVALARECPGLQYGVGVEVGEAVPYP